MKLIETMQNVRKIVTHANCPDGRGTAMIANWVIAARGKHIPCVEFVSHDQLPSLVAEPGMLFVDISPDQDRIEDFKRLDAIVLDHHRGSEATTRSFGELGVFADETLEPGVSGTTLAWRELYVPTSTNTNPPLDAAVEEFARAMGARDTWHKESPLWEIGNHMSTAIMSIPVTDLLERPFPHLTTEEIYGGKIAYDAKLNDARAAAGTAKRFVGYDELNKREIAFAVYAEVDYGFRVTSDAADVLRDSGINLVASFRVNMLEDRVAFSFRSDDSVDVAKLAKTMGGGGHTRAAGANLTLQSFVACNGSIPAYLERMVRRFLRYHDGH